MSSWRRYRAWHAVLLGLAGLVVLGVGISHQFPALTHGPKTSVELLESLLRAPRDSAENAVRDLRRYTEWTGLELFVRSCDLPADCEERLLAMVRGDRFRDVTVPFVYSLYELYGGPSRQKSELADLSYAELDADQESPAGGLGLSGLARGAGQVRRHVRAALLLFDALFLQVKPEAHGQSLPFRERYSEESYERIKALVREVAAEHLPANVDAASEDQARQPAGPLGKVLEDDERLTAFVEVLSDYIRQQSDGWLESFVQRQRRRDARRAWLERCLNENRLYEIADAARLRADRKLAVQIVVDGLQGKLLEGLADLSAGRRESAAARYVVQLVQQHQSETMQPQRYGSQLPPPLGRDLVELAEHAADRPDYLVNANRFLFGPRSAAVKVHVATVESPTISVRNLQVVETGHTVAGPFGTGVPNFSYVDRASGRGWYFWGGDVAHLGRIVGNREDEIPGSQRREGPGARTLFERLAGYNAVSHMASVDTGALEKVPAELGLVLGDVQRNYTEKLLLVRLRRRAEVERELDRRRHWLAAHRHLSDSFLGSLIFQALDLRTFHDYARWVADHEDEGLPDFLLWYDPWPDHFAHPFGPFSDEIVGRHGEFDRFDFYLGKVIDVYQSVPRGPGNSTCFDRTLFGLVSDHGMVYTPRLVATDKLLLDGLREAGLQIRAHKLSVDEGELPVVRSRRQTVSMRPFDVIIGSTAGGSYVLDLFSWEGLQGDEAAWRRHPDYHQLRRHRLLSGQTIDWIAELSNRLRDVVDMAVVREYGPSLAQRWPAGVESVVRLIAPDRGDARIWRVRAEDGAIRYRYEVLGPRDPLDLVGSVRDWLLPPGGPTVAQVQEILREFLAAPEGRSDDEWRHVLSCTLRLDAIRQLSQLYDSDRAGTVNVFPVQHVGVNSAVPGRHAGATFEEHNGIQIYFGAGLQSGALQTARNGSLPVTLYHWLAGEAAYRHPDPQSGLAPADQFGYPSLLPESVFDSIRSAADR
jgi:hypothetical protein